MVEAQPTTVFDDSGSAETTTDATTADSGDSQPAVESNEQVIQPAQDNDSAPAEDFAQSDDSSSNADDSGSINASNGDDSDASTSSNQDDMAPADTEPSEQSDQSPLVAVILLVLLLIYGGLCEVARRRPEMMPAEVRYVFITTHFSNKDDGAPRNKALKP
jgi:hypothetical protein